MTSIVSPGMSGSVRGCAEGIVGPWEVHVDALMTKLYTSIHQMYLMCSGSVFLPRSVMREDPVLRAGLAMPARLGEDPRMEGPNLDEALD